MKTISKNNYLLSFFLLFFLILLIYSNTLNSSWHLDDFYNIVKSPRLKIDNLKLETLKETLYIQSTDGKKLYRPLPCLTFALNWYFGQQDVTGYHLVNIFIHIITAYFLFLTILELFKTQVLKNKYPNAKYFIALLSTIFWAANPIQTQAITYIVQRMASMAAMFFIISMFLYLKARFAYVIKKKIIYLLLFCIFFIFALASKENTALLILSLILVEIIFFKNKIFNISKKTLLISVCFCIIIIFLFLFLFTTRDGTSPFLLLDGYKLRPFTPWQRLLTESRILFFYLSQIFYPIPSRLSITHNIGISTSFINPITTLFSIIGIILIISFCILKNKKYPIFCFAILFYFANHLIESTFIGLELVFEHRNYIPSMFLFLPVAIGIKMTMDFYKNIKPYMYYVFVSFTIFLIIGFSMGTYIRNMAWASERTLWEDAVAKAPNYDRPLHNYAWGYYHGLKQYDKAIALYKKALTLESPDNICTRAWTLGNIALIYLEQKKYNQAEKLWKQSIKICPHYLKGYFGLSQALAKQGKLKEAEKQIKILTNAIKTNPDYYNLLGFILLKQNKPKEAISYFKKSIKLNNQKWNVMINLGLSYNMLGQYNIGTNFFQKANLIKPNEPVILFSLAENSMLEKNFTNANNYVNKFIKSVGNNNIDEYLNKLINDRIIKTDTYKPLLKLISKNLKNKADNLKKISSSILNQHN